MLRLYVTNVGTGNLAWKLYCYGDGGDGNGDHGGGEGIIQVVGALVVCHQCWHRKSGMDIIL